MQRVRLEPICRFIPFIRLGSTLLFSSPEIMMIYTLDFLLLVSQVPLALFLPTPDLQFFRLDNFCYFYLPVHWFSLSFYLFYVQWTIIQSSSHLLNSSSPEFVWFPFIISVSLVKDSFCSLILFASSLNYLPMIFL